MDECTDSLGEAMIFSKLDTNLGFWQVEIDERVCRKTPSEVTMGSISLSACVSD